MSFDFLDVDFGADFTVEDAFDFASIGSGSFEYTMYLSSFLMSICCGYSNAYIERSVLQIAVITSRILRSYAGTNISRAADARKN